MDEPLREPSRRQPGRPAAESDRPDVRDALLEAAGRLFARHGAAEVSLRRVADEAGVTPAMVHYYFGSREGLYDAMLERAFSRVLARVREVARREAGGEDPEAERFGALLEVLVGTFAAEPWIPTLVVREVLAEGGRFRERFVRGYASQMAALLPGLMQREIAAGHFRSDLDPRLTFLSFMGMTLVPFVARPVVERVLGLEYDAAFLRDFVAHTRGVFLDGVRS
jgi:AcrR family transcriptional regulator